MASPPKITAEWIVRAQLTICRPDDKSKVTIRANQEADTQYSIENQSSDHFQGENPIKVVYKWCSSDANQSESTSVFGSVLSTPNVSSNGSSSLKDSGSFRSGVTSSDSGIGTTTTSTSKALNGQKCRTTCNIVLTACTNIIPEPNEVAENIATTYYTVFPEDEVNHRAIQACATWSFWEKLNVLPILFVLCISACSNIRFKAICQRQVFTP